MNWFNVTCFALAAVIFCLLTGCASEPTAQAPSANVNIVVGSADDVAKGLAQTASIQDALNLMPKEAKSWAIQLRPGIYTELVEIQRDNVTLFADEPGKTTIQYGRYAGQRVNEHSDETWGTFRTSTVRVKGQGTRLVNLTIANSFDYPANEALPKGHPDKIRGEQAVALEIHTSADRTLVQNVVLVGYQDTLYANGGRSYFWGGKIAGHVDFIFGAGNVLFEQTDIISRARAYPHRFTGYITAPSTLIKNDHGFTFRNCRLLREPGVPDNSVPLGRPWHPTTTFEDGRYANPFAVGKSVYIHTYMDRHIADVGWWSMGGTAKDGSRKKFMPLTDARFFEYRSTGPGAKVSDSRPQLSEEQMVDYFPETIFQDWQPTLY